MISSGDRFKRFNKEIALNSRRKEDYIIFDIVSVRLCESVAN